MNGYRWMNGIGVSRFQPNSVRYNADVKRIHPTARVDYNTPRQQP